ncbi:MAG TPA: hypothetical protein VNW92_00385 [Polyangiaceae bacterium]|jgi:hypothetical protein|nr:hypothetical protein [Polyangiaceae bacterium]
MNYARLSSSLCVSLVVAVLAASCTSSHDTADVVPAPPGAFQSDAGGKLIDEATACAELTQAESSARAALGCAAPMRDCPAYIRPAGGAGCFLYDEASVAGCVDQFNTFGTCDAFDARPCLVTAVSHCDSGAGGAGGQSGTAAGGAESGGEAAVAGGATVGGGAGAG